MHHRHQEDRQEDHHQDQEEHQEGHHQDQEEHQEGHQEEYLHLCREEVEEVHHHL
jgi:hypothetical protein